jgi:hypothetical protein
VKDFLFLFTLVLLCGSGCTLEPLKNDLVSADQINKELDEFKGSIRFSPAKNYSQEEKEVLAISERLANELVQSQCFEEYMLKRNLIQTNGKSNLEVVNDLRNTDLTIPVVMYYSNNNVVGYRQPPSKTIYTNRKFHAGASACSRGSNLTHEWSHSVGYGHSSRATYSRPRSVPYSINAAFTKCCSCRGVRDCAIKGASSF